MTDVGHATLIFSQKSHFVFRQTFISILLFPVIISGFFDAVFTQRVRFMRFAAVLDSLLLMFFVNYYKPES